ncbi:MAG: YfhO family protein [Oscillospiraceae bacterium]|jgi:uncharacterized membrane protein YfhO|nr:YfhO family protein [Oscillospiraceae bacterium]
MSDSSSPGANSARRLIAFVQSNAFVWLSVLVSALVMLFVYFCFSVIPFGEKTVLRMDLYHQYGPLFAELYDRITTNGTSMLYSWYSGLGGNFLGNYFNYLSNPFGLVILLFGHENMPEAIGAMVVLCNCLGAGSFAYMLRKMFAKNGLPITAFGVLYSFCGWFIAYYWNVMWISVLVWLPLVALGIHYIVKEKRFLLYTLALALTLVSNYYMGFMVCAFSVIFFFVRAFSDFGEGGRITAADSAGIAGGGKGRITALLRSGSIFALGSVMAGLMAAGALVPVYFALRSSSATSGTFPTEYQSYFSIFDFLANQFADTVPTIRSSGEDVLPNIYSGVITLLLVPLFLFVKDIKAGDKAINICVLVLLFFSFNTNYLNYIWHAMHFPNDLPYRFSFLYSFMLLLIAYRVLLRIKEIPPKAIVAVGASVAVFIVLTEKLGSKNVETLSIYITLAFVAIYTILLFAIRNQKASAAYLGLTLLCCVVIEACAADTNNFEITQVKSNFTVDYQDFQKMKKDFFSKDKSLYRMEVTDSRSLMDPAWFGYKGVSVFSSMAIEHTANLESRLGLGSNYINSYTYNPQTPVYNAMHGIKYLIENMNFEGDYHGSSFLPVLNRELYGEKYAFSRYTVFENKYTLPIAYWVQTRVENWDYTGEDPFKVQMDYWERASHVSDVFTPILMQQAFDATNTGTIQFSYDNQYISYSGKPEGETRRMAFNIVSAEAQNCYLYADLAGVESVTVKRLNRETGITEYETRSHNAQAVWDLGVVYPDAPLGIELQLSATAPASAGFYCYTYALNMDAFVSGWENLNSVALDVTSFDDTHIIGTVTAPGDGLLYTSIPYDKGWRATVDGQAVDIKGIANDAFLTVPISGGTHSIELHFTPQGFWYGLIGSAVGLAVFLFFALVLRKRRGDPPPAEDAAPDGGVPPLPEAFYNPPGGARIAGGESDGNAVAPSGRNTAAPAPPITHAPPDLTDIAPAPLITERLKAVLDEAEARADNLREEIPAGVQRFTLQ